MALANAFLEPPQRPSTLDAAVQIIDALWRQLQACREQLGLNSSNSSLPPSQDRLSGQAKDRFSRQPSGKRRGAQKGHVAHPRDLVPEAAVDRIERHFPEARCTGGGEIVIDPHPQSRHQVFDLPEITYSVTEHQRFGGTCRGCQRSITAQLPQDIPSGQMGPGLIAWIALMSAQHPPSPAPSGDAVGAALQYRGHQRSPGTGGRVAGTLGRSDRRNGPSGVGGPRR